MEDCSCSKQEDITVLKVTQERVLKLLDGNGKSAIEVRLSKLETMQVEVTEIVSSQEILRKTVSGLVEAEKYIEQQKRTASQLKRDRFTNNVKVIGVVLLVIGLVFEIFFK